METQFNEMLVRLDERTKKIQTDISEIKTNLENNYVTTPTRLIVYGIVGSFLIAALTTIFSLVIHHATH